MLLHAVLDPADEGKRVAENLVQILRSVLVQVARLLPQRLLQRIRGIHDRLRALHRLEERDEGVAAEPTRHTPPQHTQYLRQS